MLDEVVEQAPALLGADACAIRLLEGDELVVERGRRRGRRRRARLALAGDRAGSPATSCSRARPSPSPTPAPTRGSSRPTRCSPPATRAYLGVPLVGPEGASTACSRSTRSRRGTWRRGGGRGALALAGNASAALSNAELYQRVALEKERSVAILANIADGIVAVDRDGKVVLWNAAAEQITGVPAAGGARAHAARGPAADLESATRRAGRRPARLDQARRRRGLALAHRGDDARPGRAPSPGRIFAFRDISAERVVEQMKSDFVSDVSHELRSPLTSIYGFAETLLRQDVLFGEDERRDVPRLHRLRVGAADGDRRPRSSNVARLDTGDLQVQLAPTDVSAVVAEVVTIGESVARASTATISCSTCRHEPLAAAADREKLRQILIDLVDNAVKFSPSGGTVTVAARRATTPSRCSVVDEGIGIPRGRAERIFTKFYRPRAPDATSRAAAPASGSSSRKELVAAMGGRIWVDSREGEGSSFAFELPSRAGA